jgi:hypothetical protein
MLNTFKLDTAEVSSINPTQQQLSRCTSTDNNRIIPHAQKVTVLQSNALLTGMQRLLVTKKKVTVGFPLSKQWPRSTANSSVGISTSLSSLSAVNCWHRLRPRLATVIMFCLNDIKLACEATHPANRKYMKPHCLFCKISGICLLLLYIFSVYRSLYCCAIFPCHLLQSIFNRYVSSVGRDLRNCTVTTTTKGMTILGSVRIYIAKSHY